MDSTTIGIFHNILATLMNKTTKPRLCGMMSLVSLKESDQMTVLGGQVISVFMEQGWNILMSLKVDWKSSFFEGHAAISS